MDHKLEPQDVFTIWCLGFAAGALVAHIVNMIFAGLRIKN